MEEKRRLKEKLKGGTEGKEPPGKEGRARKLVGIKTARTDHKTDEGEKHEV